MELVFHPFELINWNEVPEEIHEGDSGKASWKVLKFGKVRIRMLEYSPGYKADHWCVKGHVLHCLAGEMDTELEDGRVFKLTTGMTYLVGDNSEPHRSSTKTGCELLIVD